MKAGIRRESRRAPLISYARSVPEWGVFATNEGDFVFGRGTGLNRGAVHLLVIFGRKNGIVATYCFVAVHPPRQQPLIIRDFIPNRDWKERYRKPGTDFCAGK